MTSYCNMIFHNTRETENASADSLLLLHRLDAILYVKGEVVAQCIPSLVLQLLLSVVQALEVPLHSQHSFLEEEAPNTNAGLFKIGQYYQNKYENSNRIQNLLDILIPPIL